MHDELEEWRAIPRWPNHEASNLGRIRRNPKVLLLPGHVLRQHEQPTGYLAVRTVVGVHVLVAEAFFGLAPASQIANHKDGNKKNNRLDNLEWVTRSQNNHHAFDTGLRERGENHDLAKLTNAQVMEIRQRYQGRWGEQSRLAEEYGVSQGLVSQILRGDIWRHLPMGPVSGSVSHSNQPGNPSITREMSDAIRKRCATGLETHAEISRDLQISRRVVSDIASGRRWKDKPSRPNSGALGQQHSEQYKVRVGEQHPKAKLTDQQILEIRAKYTGKRGEGTALAREYDVSRPLISMIVHGKRWKHLKQVAE